MDRFCRFFGIMLPEVNPEATSIIVKRMSDPQFRDNETSPWKDDPVAAEFVPDITTVPKAQAADCQPNVACHVVGDTIDNNWTARNLFATDVLEMLEEERLLEDMVEHHSKSVHCP